MSENKHFIVCVHNSGYEGALELRKLYEMIADAPAEKHEQFRVIDESGEDYVYPASWFVPVELCQTAEDQLSSRASK